MHRWFCLLLAGLLAGAAPAADAAHSSPAPEINAESVADFFDTAFDVQRQDHRMVGAVVSVVQNGEVIFERGYGWADLEARVPADPEDSLFRIASISKTFVWTALMQLSEQGRLDLNGDVNTHLDFKIPETYSEPIRVWHLMTHTPGFEDKNIGVGVRTFEEMAPLGEFLASAMPARVRPPGEHASYSNYGAALAGYLVERITGQPWSDYVDENILTQLGMNSTNTHSRLSPEFSARHAAGYRYRGGRFVASDYEYLQDTPAGVMSSTARDMSRFMLAHLGEGEYRGVRILESHTARKMHSPLFPKEFPKDPALANDIAPMLHGFYRSDRNGVQIFGHGGDVNQFHSDLSLFPDQALGVFVSFNSDPAANARGNLVNAFVDHFFPSEYLREAPTAGEVELSDYTGEYIPLRSNWSSIERLSMLVQNLTIGAADGELLLGSGEASRWVPTAPDRFVARYANRNMVFERDDTGAISHVVIGSPLGTYVRVRGLDAPTTIRNLVAFLILVAAFTVLGYGYRGLRRAAPGRRLPSTHVLVGWLHAILLIGLYAQLALALTGDVEEFQFGVPSLVHAGLLIMNANALIGLAVIGFAIIQWRNSSGAILARLRYTVLALAAIVNLWIGWYFNLLGYGIL